MLKKRSINTVCAVGALALLLVALQEGYAQNSAAIDLTPTIFKDKLASEANAKLIDLRTTKELESGVIAGAIQIDYFEKDFEKKILALDRGQKYFLYCAVGGRSAETAEFMIKNGFQQVYNLKEGIHGWKRSKFPVVPFRRQ